MHVSACIQKSSHSNAFSKLEVVDSGAGNNRTFARLKIAGSWLHQARLPSRSGAVLRAASTASLGERWAPFGSAIMPSIQDVKVKGTSSGDVVSSTGAALAVAAERRSAKSEILE